MRRALPSADRRDGAATAPSFTIANVTLPADATAIRPPQRARGGGLLLLLVLLVLALGAAGWYRWRQWRATEARAQALAGQQRDALASRIDAIRDAQRRQAARLQQAETTNRVLRDELLGLGQRAAVVEDSVSRLADPDRHGAQALRLDQVELLLAIGQQRLRLDGDTGGAQRALALAAPLLAGIDDPAYLNLRQTLAQEQAAMEALGPDPRTRAGVLLDQLVDDLPADAPTAAATAPEASWYARLLDRIVRVQPTASAGLRQRADRDAALAAVQIEASLARAAIERRDGAGLRRALDRIDAWLQRLLAGSPQLQQRQRWLAQLRGIALQSSTPLAGTTLAQLRALRGG